MKAGIHPQYFEATVTCGCGNTFVVGSTKPKIEVDICSSCHPFFTGEMRFVDRMGRVERFQSRQQAVGNRPVVSKKAQKILKRKQEEQEEAMKPKSLREMMDRVKAKA